MAYEFRLPDLGEGVAEGEIARWHVEVGQTLEEDDPLVEIQTDKATVEIPSPVGGAVLELRAGEGDVVPVGSVLVVISAPVQAREDVPSRVQATPIVRRAASELGVDLRVVRATGAAGQITREDVVLASAREEPEVGEPAPGERRPLRGVRRAIAEHLTRSHREVPAVTVVEECDFTELGRTRGELSYLPFVLEAVAEGFGPHPELNATFDGVEVTVHERRDIGIAVQTERGLVVPVVRAVDRLSLQELDREVKRLADGARADTLKPEELRGSTFTVTSAGRLGGLFATPLVNVPEVAILGVHRIAPRAVVRGGEIVVREVGFLALTFDHRVLDGATASSFLLEVIDRLETPSAGG